MRRARRAQIGLATGAAAAAAAVTAVLGAVAAPGVVATPAGARATLVATGGGSEPTGSITVSAAASLTEAFDRMGDDFEERYEGTSVSFNYGSSSTLAAQIRGGAPADVLASADRAAMRKVVRSGDVIADPVDFAANRLTVVVKPGNPEQVERLADLPDVGTVALCVPAAPCGRYAAKLLRRGGVTIPRDHITLGQDALGTLAAVSTGDADAAIVYRTDGWAADRSVTEVRVAAARDLIAVYPIAPVAASGNPSLAGAWIDYVVSPAGQRALARFGFLPVAAASWS